MQGSKELYPCRFCGTAVIVMGGVDPEEYAARNCTCAESKEYRRRMEDAEAKEVTMSAAYAAIEEVMADADDQEAFDAISNMMIDAVGATNEGFATSVVIKRYGESFKVSKNGKGKILIERTKKLAKNKEG